MEGNIRIVGLIGLVWWMGDTGDEQKSTALGILTNSVSPYI